MNRQEFLTLSDRSLIHLELLNWRLGLGKPVLVLLHDALGSVPQWKNFPEHLAKMTECPVLIYERQGHGKSSPLLEPRTKSYLHHEALQVLPEILHHFQVQWPVLIGHSDGGTIALIHAAHHRQIRAVATLAAHIYVEEVTLQGIRQTLDESRVVLAKLEKYHAGNTNSLFKAWHETWLSDWFKDWSIQSEIQKITAPCLIIQGESDAYATQDHASAIADSIGKSAELTFLADCGHMLHLEAEDELLHKLVKFISSNA